jgi:hypothetical protein
MLRKGLDAAEAAFQVGYESPSQFGREYRRMFGRFPGEQQGDAVKGILRTNNPSKRMADPLEIAKLAVYLASDDSAYKPQSSPYGTGAASLSPGPCGNHRRFSIQEIHVAEEPLGGPIVKPLPKVVR